ncbi:phytanoyl-CoA dioxygenase family protein [Devosia algicola]|uniref:Phytanoyl-CoA dioxygenase family protein n=1 Tax=Devosia algicola TaxID=3026418 RepID=A0ABY7YP85_9HYPH|nr:phytanoyl-CoA dioxygenase family protein [Devosia algicola]WDR03064.1 phytanoyl-CoA dioxygenase family protein [Devosia algicola]
MSQITLSREQRQLFDQNGFLAVRGLFRPDEVAMIRETFMEQGKHGPVAGLSDLPKFANAATAATPNRDDPLSFYPRMMNPHKHADKPVGSLTLKYMRDVKLKQVLSELFGETPYACQSMFYFKPPGARGQDLHQDNFYLRVKPGTCMAAWLAIDDVDEANGGMMCVPQTDHLDIACPDKADPATSFTTDRVEPPEGLEPEYVRLNAGDVLFFNGSVIHGSTPNISKDRFRRSLIFHYVPASTREMSKHYDAYSFEGERQDVAVNDDGGPCGTLQDMPTAPH